LERTGFNSDNTDSLGQFGYISSYNGRFYTVSFGSNGIALDPQGRIVWCAQGDRAIVRLEKDGKRTILADRYDGKRLNRPNDLVVKSDGWVYFTDPRGNNLGQALELPFPGVYRVKDGNLQLLEKEISPNGITFSADEKYLYTTGGGKIWRYDVGLDGTIGNRREFSPVGCDGMKVDLAGNLYCASGANGGVRIISREGKALGTILTPHDDGRGPTNIAFGDPDGKTLYITIKRTLARIRLHTEGFRPNLNGR
jgi:gluconolactonase